MPGFGILAIVGGGALAAVGLIPMAIGLLLLVL